MFACGAPQLSCTRGQLRSGTLMRKLRLVVIFNNFIFFSNASDLLLFFRTSRSSRQRSNTTK